MSITQGPISRRKVLAAAAVGGMLTTTKAKGETGDQAIEPRRSDRGGSNKDSSPGYWLCRIIP